MASIALNKRQGWIDQYRGVLFLLVIINHTFKVPLCFQHIIDFVYLPGFFFLSGYLFRPKGFKTNLLAIINSLLIPFFIYSAIISLYASIANRDFNLIYDTFIEYFILGGDGIWFIPCLIVVEIVFSIVLNLTSRRSGVLLLCLCGILFSYFIGGAEYGHLPWNIDTSMFCIAFFSIGYLIKGKGDLDLFSSLLLFVFYIINTQILGNELYSEIKVDLHNNIIGNYFIYVFLSFVGSCSLFAFCRHLYVLWYFEKLGRYTLFSFPFHPFIYRAMVKVFSFLGGGDSTLIDLIIIPIITGLVLIIVCMILEKYTPYLLGRYKYISVKEKEGANRKTKKI